MQSEGSSPFSQEPATGAGPYFELNKSSSQYPFYIFMINFNITLQS
jgi:hypothetical protein